MKRTIIGVAALAAALAITGCEDRSDRGELKRDVKELAPGEQTNRERADKIGDDMKDAADKTGDAVRDGAKDVKRQARETKRDAQHRD